MSVFKCICLILNIYIPFFYQKLVNLAPKWNKFSHPHVQIIVTPLTLIKSVAENMVPLS